MVISVRLEADQIELLGSCKIFLNTMKKKVGLEESTTNSEVIRYALQLMAEHHQIAKPGGKKGKAK